MKILIAADIHGSQFYMQKLAERFDIERADQMILLGDIYNHGPRNPLPQGYNPMEVAKILNGMTDKLTVLKGNCDSDVDTLISEFDFVAEAVVFSGNTKIFLQHGDRYNLDRLPRNAGDVFIYGHFHTGFIKREGDLIVANCGSVSLPKENTPRSYIVLENSIMKLKDLEGNVLAEKEF